MPRNGSAFAENRECHGAIAGAGFVADGSRGTVDDHSGGGPDHGVDLGPRNRRGAALLVDQKSRQLLWPVWGRAKFGEPRAAHAIIEAAQQTFADDADRSSKDGAALQPGAGHAV